MPQLDVGLCGIWEDCPNVLLVRILYQILNLKRVCILAVYNLKAEVFLCFKSESQQVKIIITSTLKLNLKKNLKLWK